MSVERLNEFISTGRLIRHSWAGTDAAGRETACMLAALSPEVAKLHSPGACPADIMPPWLAYLTPWIDDQGSEAKWPGVITRYANLAGRWHVLSEESWDRGMYRCRRVALIEAMSHTKDEKVLRVCAGTMQLLDRQIAGDKPTLTEWHTARAAAAAKATTAAAAKATTAAKAEAAAAAWAAAWAAEVEAA